jgi:two-component system response regulator DegU
MNKIRLAIVDDQEMARKATIRLLSLEKDLEVILEAEHGIDLLQKLPKSNPDIILMDIQMPKMNGIEATEKVLAQYPNIKIIALTQFDNEQNIIEMYSRGVKSFFSKGHDPSELVKAIRVIQSGGVYVTDKAFKILRICLSTYSAAKPEKYATSIDDRLGILSNTELIVLWHTSNRKSIKQIANDLCLSPNTINNHHAHIRKKLQLKGRKSIMEFALSVKEKLSLFTKNKE